MKMCWGDALRLTLFGSSHGPVVGAVVEGVPAGLPINKGLLQLELDRRRPLGRRLATKRRESDELHLLGGVAEGKTTGKPIVGLVRNVDIHRGPYLALQDVPRPGHADFPARMRWGKTLELSGGGIFSGRMTVGLVFAGAVAKALLNPKGIDVMAYTVSLGGVELPPEFAKLPITTLRERSISNEVSTPDPAIAARMEEAIEAARREGDSVGGVVECRAEGLPVGVGEPFFDSVESTLAHALFSIPAVKGVEFGSGFISARLRGSENNDAFILEGGRIRTRTNNSGGILGGLTTGMPVVLRVSVKPTSSIAREQDSVSISAMEPRRLIVKGRHDPCIVPRAVPVIESVTAFCLADLMLRGGFIQFST